MKMTKFLLIAAGAMGMTFSAMAADVAVTITGNDTMQFDKKAFKVSAGDVVTLTFKNVGKLPIVAMGHNLVILNAGEVIAPFAIAAMTQKANDYIPPAMADKILAKSKLLGPGEEDVLTFTAPAAGTYNYLCTFPGHYAVMNGVMTVK
jgi:azurin